MPARRDEPTPRFDGLRPSAACGSDQSRSHMRPASGGSRPRSTARTSSSVTPARYSTAGSGYPPNFAKTSTACSGTRPLHAAHKENASCRHRAVWLPPCMSPGARSGSKAASAESTGLPAGTSMTRRRGRLSAPTNAARSVYLRTRLRRDDRPFSIVFAALDCWAREGERLRSAPLRLERRAQALAPGLGLGRLRERASFVEIVFDPPPRNIHVAAAASPRSSSTDIRVGLLVASWPARHGSADAARRGRHRCGREDARSRPRRPAAA